MCKLFHDLYAPTSELSARMQGNLMAVVDKSSSKHYIVKVTVAELAELKDTFSQPSDKVCVCAALKIVLQKAQTPPHGQHGILEMHTHILQ